MSDLRSKSIRLAAEMPPGRGRRKLLAILVHTDPQYAPLASFAQKTARGSEWDGTVVGERTRIRWNSRYGGNILIEELPGKPFKRYLRTALFDLGGVFPGGVEHSAFLIPNLIRSARFGKSMNFDRAVLAVEAALDLAKVETGDALKDWQEKSLSYLPHMQDVFYLEVEPGDYTPLDVRGKDFGVRSKWTDFDMYEDSGVTNPSEGMSDFYKSKSPGAARKMFKLVYGLVKAGKLASMTFAEFRRMLDKNKIGYDYVPSVWR